MWMIVTGSSPAEDGREPKAMIAMKKTAPAVLPLSGG
jgi:hypothetical protein